ncbi:MAG: hypothetical protein VXW32_15630 [Myxococcota bacterium]|nr:hypothetical protein [Myxococcota bacterium]
MQWLTNALDEIRDILQRQAVLTGPMSDDLESARLDRDLEKLLGALAGRIAACEGVEVVLATKGETLMASSGPLIDYVALAEALHAAQWAMEKVANAYELGPIEQTALIGGQKKLSMLSVGEVSIAMVAEQSTNLSDSLGM